MFGLIGPTALPALAAYLADLWHTDSSRISAIASIEQMGKQWPDARGEALAILEEKARQKKAKSKMAKLSRKKNRKR